MKITVITPTIKVNHFLYDAINTVKLQTYTGLIEHIVIVDSPLIEVPKPSIFRNYSLNYFINNGDNGPSNARNLGLDRSTGDIVCFLDADDLWDNNYLNIISELYKSNLNINAISTIGYQFQNNNNLKKIKFANAYAKNGILDSENISWNVIGCPSGFSYIFSEDLKTLRFLSSARYFEDYMFYLMFHFKFNKTVYRCNETNFWYRKSHIQSTHRALKYHVENSKNIILESLKNKNSNISKYNLTICVLQINRLSMRLLGENAILITINLILKAPSYFFSNLLKYKQQIVSYFLDKITNK